MLDSKQIRTLLLAAHDDDQRSPRLPRGDTLRDERIRALKNKINDQDYVDFALRKIASDLAKDFY